MIDWQNIDTVLLDMDGTLLDLHFDNYFWLHHLPQRYSDAHNVPLEEAQEHIHQKIAALEGTLQWYCLDHWSELMRMDIPALKHEIKHKIQIRPHAERFLQALKKQGKKLVLITNSHPAGLELKMQVTEIDRWLDIIISSHQFQSPKEDLRFWQQLQLEEPFDPKRSVFIDDSPRILKSGQSYGIKHLVCITRPDSQKPAHDSGPFIGVSDFDELLPELENESVCPTRH
ncbi:GMP/IMP nucleotidase [Agaribacterium sp. ZY112]|uniref:GMP/IMP nucleotidase n=1 Tax=Agaribacterium sp. ZY112 TaxID=3233574 RepID=UPI003524F829